MLFHWEDDCEPLDTDGELLQGLGDVQLGPVRVVSRARPGHGSPYEALLIIGDGEDLGEAET